MALTAWSRPLPAGQVALAALGGLWAPGYAAVAVAYPRGRLVALERHALAFAAGILLLPVVGLLASELLGFRAAAIAGVLFALTSVLAATALRRRAHAPEAAARSAMPGTRATLAIAGACLVASAAIVAWSWRPEPVPSSLAIVSSDPPTLVFEATAGARPVAGSLVVTWDGAPILSRDLALDAGATERILVPAPSDAEGAHTIEARWDGRVVRAHVAGGGA